MKKIFFLSVIVLFSYVSTPSYGNTEDHVPEFLLDQPIVQHKKRLEFPNTKQTSSLPDGQLDIVEISYEDGVIDIFNNHPTSIFADIARVLKSGGELRFNMWRGRSAEEFRELFLEAQQEIKRATPEYYKQLEKMEPKQLIAHVRSSLSLNPFDQFLTENDYTRMQGKSLFETHAFQEYAQQLSMFFERVDLIGLIWNTFEDEDEEFPYWCVFKK